MKELYEAVKHVVETGRNYYNGQEVKRADNLKRFHEALKQLRDIDEHVWLLMDNCTAFYLDNPTAPWRLSAFNILKMIDIACGTVLFPYWVQHDGEWY